MKDLNIQLDMRSKVAIVDQIRVEILRLIDANQFEPGSQLPTVREIAARLGVNFNTVARAYRQLDQAGWITTRQGRGSYINERPNDQRLDLRKPWLLDEADLNVVQIDQDHIQPADGIPAVEQSLVIGKPQLTSDTQPVDGISVSDIQHTANTREESAHPPSNEQDFVVERPAASAHSTGGNESTPESLLSNQPKPNRISIAYSENQNQAGAQVNKMITQVDVIAALVEQIQISADQLGRTTPEMLAMLQSTLERRKPGRKRLIRRTQVKIRLSGKEWDSRSIKGMVSHKSSAKRKR